MTAASRVAFGIALAWLCTALLVHAVPARAQGEPGDAPTSDDGGDVFSDADEAARKSSNPLGGDFIILLNQIDNYFLDKKVGSGNPKVNTWAFQPVIPIPMEEWLGEHWIWVNRPTLAMVMNADLPDTSGLMPGLGGGGGPSIPPGFPPGGFPPNGLPFQSEGGLADLVFFSLLGQSLPTEKWGGGDFVWGLGPTFQFPTATKRDLGSGKVSMGPAAVASFIGKEFIVGGLFQHWNNIASAGKGTGNTVNFSWLNLFYFLNFENGWQVGGTPVITADWEASSSNRWTVPIGLGVYKTSFIAGKLPLKVGVEAQWMPKRPDILGQQFNIRLVFAPILPSPFGSL